MAKSAQQWRLMGTATSPFARKIRILMIEKSCPFTWYTEDVWGADATIPQYNPLAKVPCLILFDGTAIFDSRALVDVVESHFHTPAFLPSDVYARMLVRRWETVFDGVLDAAILVRLETIFRDADKHSEKWVKHQWAKVEAGLAFAESLCTEAPYLYGNSFGLADVAFVCCVEWLTLRFPAFDWKKIYPKLQQHHQRIAQRASLVTTRPGL